MTGVLVYACVIAIAVPFVVYPALLWLRSVLAPRPIRPGGDPEPPAVALVIAAHDEADSIGERLENALALEYPGDRLEILVASDGSTDATVEIANRYADRGVRVLDLPRVGKAAALTAAVEASSAPILAFSDANSDWAPDALARLVAPFADPEVGAVAGNQCYVRAEGDRSADGERGYWHFDRWQKRWQSRAGQTISATGAIHAIRRECFEPPPPDATDDFMISTGAIAAGRRLVFAEEARAWEPPAEPSAGEYRRKVRIITRGLRAVAYRRALLDPRRTGSYALLLGVHKLWRRLVWIPLAALVVLAPFALAGGGLPALLAGGAAAGVALGTLGWLRPALSRLRVVAIARHVLLVNAACAQATYNALRGHRVARWETERAAPPTPERLR